MIEVTEEQKREERFLAGLSREELFAHLLYEDRNDEVKLARRHTGIKLGSRLKQFRETKGYTQRDLANLAGITQNRITDAELGNSGMKDLETFVSLANVLDVRPVDLASREQLLAYGSPYNRIKYFRKERTSRPKAKRTRKAANKTSQDLSNVVELPGAKIPLPDDYDRREDELNIVTRWDIVELNQKIDHMTILLEQVLFTPPVSPEDEGVRTDEVAEEKRDENPSPSTIRRLLGL